MPQDLVATILNPSRQRIGQYLAVNGQATVSELSKALSDIPKPSIYRHVNIMLKAGLLKVVAEQNIRGTVEKTYALMPHEASEFKDKELGAMFQSALIYLSASFASYFKKPGADPLKDMLGISSCLLMLSDAEYTELMGKINVLLTEALNNKQSVERKQRNITLISSPIDEKERK